MTVDALGVAIRFALYLDLMAAFGLATFGVLSLRGAERATALPLRWTIVGAGLIGLALSVVAICAMAAAMAGVPLQAVDRATVSMLVMGTAAGTAWIVRMVALAIMALAPALARKRPGPALLTAVAAGAIALSTLAWTGHGAMDDGTVGWVHLGADIVHLLAAGVWIGALLGLSMLILHRAAVSDMAHITVSHRALDGFSRTGSVVVAAIVVSGLINSWLLVAPDNIGRLLDSTYGLLFVAKLMLFGAMLALASINRFRLTPAFEAAIAADDVSAARRALVISLGIETACAVVILALVTWLGTLEPPASAM